MYLVLIKDPVSFLASEVSVDMSASALLQMDTFRLRNNLFCPEV